MSRSSFELLTLLAHALPSPTERDPWWWPHSGTFEVVIGALLTQQSRRERVEESLKNLALLGWDSPETLQDIPDANLCEAIRPSGCHTAKAPRLRQLSRHMLRDFGDFATFQHEVSRAWLLGQKGIGPESADAILCYACHREAMVVDSYTARILARWMGWDAAGYEDIQAWLIAGLRGRNEASAALLGESELSTARLYALMHGLLVEYAKRYLRGKTLTGPLVDGD